MKFKTFINEKRMPKGYIKGIPSHEKAKSIINAGWNKSDGITFIFKDDEVKLNFKGGTKVLSSIIDGYTEERNISANKLDNREIKADNVNFKVIKISDMEWEIVIK